MVIPLTTSAWMMLQRNLLYTAVTRAKKLVVLVGSRKALGQAVRAPAPAAATPPWPTASPNAQPPSQCCPDDQQPFHCGLTQSPFHQASCSRTGNGMTQLGTQVTTGVSTTNAANQRNLQTDAGSAEPIAVQPLLGYAQSQDLPSVAPATFPMVAALSCGLCQPARHSMARPSQATESGSLSESRAASWRYRDRARETLLISDHRGH